MTRPGAETIVAVDLGGTRMRAATFGPDDRIDRRLEGPTPASGGPDAVVDALADLVGTILAGAPAGSHPTAGVVVAATGPIDAAGSWVDPSNLGRAFHGYPLGRRLADRLGRPLLVGLDTRFALLGERRAGALRGYRDGVFVTVSTGVGGAFLVDDRVVAGASGTAGEVGHLPVSSGGPRCGCGARGHLEAIASGPAMARAATQAARAGRSARLLERLLAAGPSGLTGTDVADAAAAGDVVAAVILKRARRALGRAVVGLLNVLDPACVVLGGGAVLAEPDPWIEACHAEMEHGALVSQRSAVEIVAARLGDDAGLVGCLDHPRLGARWIRPAAATSFEP